MSVKFVILSAARSGSSLVVETLNSHPDLLVHGEIFHEDFRTHIRPNVPLDEALRLRELDPRRFVDYLLSFDDDKAAVGFKMWQPQSPLATDYVLDNPGFVKVILERKNRLAQFASGRLAESTGIWDLQAFGNDGVAVNFVPDEVRGAHDAFHVYQFRNFCAYQDNMFAHYRSKARGEVVELDYIDAANLRFEKIFSALRVQSIPLIAAKRRIYSEDILDRYPTVDHDLIRNELLRLDRSEWVKEVIS